MNFPRVVDAIDPPGPEASRLLDHCRARRERIIAALIDDIAAGIRILATRDKVPLTELQIAERARNITAGLVGNYNITLPGDRS